MEEGENGSSRKHKPRETCYEGNKIFGFDIDPNMIRIAKENAERADVASLIHFETCPVKILELRLC